jgi:isoleucyl-tRNA synthetase
VAFSPNLRYCSVLSEKEVFVIAEDCLERLKEQGVIPNNVTILKRDVNLTHSFYDAPFSTASKINRLIPADFVTSTAGTGLVHLSPDHGVDDFAACAPFNHIKPLNQSKNLLF